MSLSLFMIRSTVKLRIFLQTALVLIFTSFLLSCSGCIPRSHSLNSGEHHSNHLELFHSYASYDASIVDKTVIYEARRKLGHFRNFNISCSEYVKPNPDSAEDLLQELLGPDGIQVSPEPGKPEENTLTYALAKRRGTCASIVAAVLAITRDGGCGFQAVILKEHVVLGLDGYPGIYFEVLQEGKRLSENDVYRLHPLPPGGPDRVDATGYIPYYLDNLASRLSDAGEDTKARTFFKEALRKAEDNGRIHYNYGTFLLEHGECDKAEEHLALAIENGWDDADTWVNRGVALSRLGRLDDAKDCFEEALRLDPKNRRALVNLRALDRQ